jgi:hypothetical protein
MLLRYIYVDSRNTITNNRIQQYNHCQHRPAQSSGTDAITGLIKTGSRKINRRSAVLVVIKQNANTAQRSHQVKKTVKKKVPAKKKEAAKKKR